LAEVHVAGADAARAAEVHMKLLSGCRTETIDAVSDILACMTGEDGGGSFVRLCNLLVAMDLKAQGGDPSAEQIIMIVRRFGNLVRTAQKAG
jgi:hypothetical protein